MDIHILPDLGYCEVDMVCMCYLFHLALHIQNESLCFVNSIICLSKTSLLERDSNSILICKSSSPPSNTCCLLKCVFQYQFQGPLSRMCKHSRKIVDPLILRFGLCVLRGGFNNMQLLEHIANSGRPRVSWLTPLKTVQYLKSRTDEISESLAHESYPDNW